MERLLKTHWRYYKGLDIYLNDVKEIIDTISSYGYRVYLTTETHSFANWDDFVMNVKKAKKLRIHSFDHLTNFEVDLHIENKSVVTLACNPPGDALSSKAFISVDNILAPCKRKYNWIYSWQFSLGVALIYAIVAFIHYFSTFKEKFDFRTPCFIILLLTIPLWFNHSFSNRLFLINRHDDLTFFERKKDEIIIGVSGFILGAIVGHFLKMINF